MDVFDFDEDVLHTEHPNSLDNIIELMNHFGLGNDYKIKIYEANTNKLYIEFHKDGTTISILYKSPNYGMTYDLITSSISKGFEEVRTFRKESETNCIDDHMRAERDMLQKRLDNVREQRDHWADEATKMYRLFFSHDEYCVPKNPSKMVAVAVRKLQAKLDKTNCETVAGE